ncbi:ABC transporter permease [Saccharomonospora sp. NPDC046836]|uniref:ABC transporter permease n=1 Tax=Saccharomonospora sp. NPDC046836 TaxID=3156921 RepID=UPI00340D88EB
MLRYIDAELRKLVSLRAMFVAAGICVVAAPALAVLNAGSIRARLDAGDTSSLADWPTSQAGSEVGLLAAVAAVVLGVFAISSEYAAGASEVGGGRQIVTSLTCVPRRGLLFAAKAIALAVVTAPLAGFGIAAGIAAAQLRLGEYGNSARQLADALGWRPLGAVVYCVCTALLALAITTITRNGLIPLVVLIINSSVVSVSILLSRLTPLAKFLPDAAGLQLFAYNAAIEDPLSPAMGGVVLAVWTAAALLAGATVLVRRDA